MVLGRRYIFETRATRTRRVLINLLISVFFLLALLSLLCVFLPMHARKQSEVSKQAFFGKSPDLIAVFTGDAGRIPTALAKMKEYPSAKVLISGVYVANSLETVVKNQPKLEDQIKEMEDNLKLVEIDYKASNTIENIIMTLDFLRKHQGFQNILIISSDYHILRVNWLIKIIKRPTDKFNFFFEGIKHNYTKWNNISKLFKEVVKLSRAFIFFWVWGDEMEASKLELPQ